MIPYNDTLEDLVRHAKRVLKELRREHEFSMSLGAATAVGILESIHRDIVAVETSLEILTPRSDP